MWWVWCMFTLWVMAMSASAVQFGDLKNCCHYCASHQEKWVQVKDAWTFNVDDTTTVNFMSPTSVTPDDSVTTGLTHQGRYYRIMYGGAPVNIKQRDVSSTDSLNEQFIQLDLGVPKAVSGVTSQGGHYREETQTLFKGRHTWMTSFAVSYLEMESSVFTFIRQENDSIRVFAGNQDAETSLVSSFTDPVMTSHVRIHPLGARELHSDAKSALLRVGTIVCSKESCDQQRLHCEVNPWLSWGPCVCQGQEGCYQRRTRTVYRYNACRGRPCSHLTEHKMCVPPEPFWSTLARYLGIAAAVLVVMAVILGVLLKKVLLDKKRKMFRRTREARERKRQDAAQSAELKLVEDSQKAADFNDFDDRQPPNSNPRHQVANPSNAQGPLVAVEEVNPRWQEDDVMDEFNMEDMTEDIIGVKGPPAYKF